MENDQMTLAEFSVVVGKSERTVRRYLSEGRLQATKTASGFKIFSSEANKFITPDLSRRDKESVAPSSAGAGRSDQTTDALHKALDLSAHLVNRSQILEERLIELELRADRERRRADSLAVELGSYQRVLSEQAESLAEERARRHAAEERAQLAETLPTTPEVDQAVELTVLERMPSMETSRPGWGSRLRRWVLGQKTG